VPPPAHPFHRSLFKQRADGGSCVPPVGEGAVYTPRPKASQNFFRPTSRFLQCDEKPHESALDLAPRLLFEDAAHGSCGGRMARRAEASGASPASISGKALWSVECSNDGAFRASAPPSSCASSALLLPASWCSRIAGIRPRPIRQDRRSSPARRKILRLIPGETLRLVVRRIPFRQKAPMGVSPPFPGMRMHPAVPPMSRARCRRSSRRIRWRIPRSIPSAWSRYAGGTRSWTSCSALACRAPRPTRR